MFVQLQKPFELTRGFFSEKGMFGVLRRSTCWREEGCGGRALFGFLEGKRGREDDKYFYLDRTFGASLFFEAR